MFGKILINYVVVYFNKLYIYSDDNYVFIIRYLKMTYSNMLDLMGILLVSIFQLPPPLQALRCLPSQLYIELYRQTHRQYAVTVN